LPVAVFATWCELTTETQSSRATAYACCGPDVISASSTFTSCRPMIDSVFDGRSTARHAFAYLLRSQHMGKVVVRLAG
jgi:hypothetical protein